MTTTTSAKTYLAGQIVSQEQIQTWVETFHRDGFLFLQDVLPPTGASNCAPNWIGHWPITLIVLMGSA